MRRYSRAQILFSTITVWPLGIFLSEERSPCVCVPVTRSRCITLTRQTTVMVSPPPGLEDFPSVQVSTSGGSGEWFELPPARLYTVSLIIKSGKVTCVDFDPMTRPLICDWSSPSVRFYWVIRSGDSGRTCKPKRSGGTQETEAQGGPAGTTGSVARSNLGSLSKLPH